MKHSRHFSAFHILIFYLSMVIFSSDLTYSQSAEALFSKGKELFESGRTDSAIRSLQKALERNYQFPEAHNMLARAYLAKNSVGDRRKATFAVNHAIDMDRKNTDYLLTLAAIYEAKYMHKEAQLIYEQIIKIDPKNEEAYKELGDLFAYFFDERNGKVSVTNPLYLLDLNLAGYKYIGPGKRMANYEKIPAWERNSFGGHYLEFDKFSDESLKKGIEIYDRLLAINPKNRGAVIGKGLLLFQAENIEGYIKHFEDVAAAKSDDPDILLFAGIGYFESGQHRKASELYEKALALFPEKKLALFENPDFFHPDFDIKKWRKNKKPQNLGGDEFWKRTDPMFLTQYDERKYTHISRVTLANLLYSFPEQNIEGWRSDQGRILIRYGRPEEIIKYTEGLLQKHTIWRYEFYSFVFSSSTVDYSNKYSLANWNGIDFKEIEEVIFDIIPDNYTLVPDERKLEFPVDIVQFRGNKGSSIVKFFYGLSDKNIEFSPRGPNISAEVLTGVYIMDENYDGLTSDVHTSIISKPTEVATDTTKSALHTFNKTFVLDPGHYNLSIEEYDLISEAKGVIRKPLDVTDFAKKTLLTSDILIAHSIEPKETNSADGTLLPVDLNNIKIVAEPERKFMRNQTISLYYEIYNLFLSPQTRKGRYDIEYIIAPVAEDKSTISKLRWWDKDESGISVKDTFSSDDSVDKNILSVQLNVQDPGQYYLIVKITDTISGQTVEKRNLLNIF